MVLRTFPSFDNSTLLIDASSPNGVAGNPIINNSDTPDGTIFVFGGGSPQIITLDDTSADVDVFDDDELASHVITDGAGIVANGTNVESESVMQFQQIDAGGNPIGPQIEITVFSQGGNFSDVWGYSTDVALIPGARYEKVSGSNLGDSVYTDFVTCFASGTRIRMSEGSALVEDIAIGDRVWTMDGLSQEVRWVSSREVPAEGVFAPVVFKAGAIGNSNDLVVSQQHRMLMSGPNAALLFQEESVLVPAKHLIGLEGVSIREGGMVTYHHFLFDTHRIVESEGALSESFYPGARALAGLERDVRNELFNLFPELDLQVQNYGSPAARCLREYEALALISRPAAA